MPNVSPRFSCAVTDFPLEDYSSGLVAAQTERFLETHRDGPFALWVSFPDPHEPWECPRAYADMFPPEKIVMPPFREGEFTDGTAPERNRVLHAMLGMEEDNPEHVQQLMACYYGMTRFVDDGLGRILDAVDANGLRENTIVVFCSDHGDLMGEHQMARKGGVFYDALTRVPLVVAWPGMIDGGATDESMANLVDVVPTVLELQGLDVPRSMQGRPLPKVTGAEPREAAFSEYGAGGRPFTMEDLASVRASGRRALFQSLQWREAEGRRKMVRTPDWKFVHDSMGDLDELYDLTADPWELTNLAGNPEFADVRAEMIRRLADWSFETEDAFPVPLP